ncbi:MAG: hypothetical protein JOZ54_08945 [Acidobacteria bacterium]|nr:hypothetical protein [Acidobacteriota bacterium]
MSEKGRLNLVNGTNQSWQLTSSSSTKLKTWDFPQTIAAGAQGMCTIETEGTSSDTRGDATYTLGDTLFTILIQLVMQDGKVTLQASWNGTEADYVVFPPAMAEVPSAIGWSKDGTVAAGVFTLSTAPIPPVAGTGWTSDWFGIYGRCLAAQKLSALTIPGTHDSGSYGISKPNKFTKTQDLDFNGQLSAGVRYFDMRIGYQPEYDDANRFILVHDFAKSVTLLDALGQITSFLAQHAAEILILDFHRFTNFASDQPDDDSNFPYAELTYWIGKGLGPLAYAIPSGRNAADVTLNDIYATSGRVLVSFNVDASVYSNAAYIPPITQVWQGGDKDWNTPDAVPKFFSCVLGQVTEDCPGQKPVAIPQNQIWAMMAAINFPPLQPPEVLSPDLDNLVYGGSEWSQECNAIATDFIEQTALVSNSVCTSVMKGTTLSS